MEGSKQSTTHAEGVWACVCMLGMGCQQYNGVCMCVERNLFYLGNLGGKQEDEKRKKKRRERKEELGRVPFVVSVIVVFALPCLALLWCTHIKAGAQI